MPVQARTSGPGVTDVVLQLTEQDQELHGMLQCSSDILTRAAAERLLSSFKVRRVARNGCWAFYCGLKMQLLVWQLAGRVQCSRGKISTL